MTHRWLVLLVSVCWLATGSFALSADLRIVTYNIDADTGGGVGQMGGPDGGPGLSAVLEAIGAAKLSGNTQPIDVWRWKK